jgi:hypothetical protein
VQQRPSEAREWLAKYLLPADPTLLAAVTQDVQDTPRTIDELYKYWGRRP